VVYRLKENVHSQSRTKLCIAAMAAATMSRTCLKIGGVAEYSVYSRQPGGHVSAGWSTAFGTLQTDHITPLVASIKRFQSRRSTSEAFAARAKATLNSSLWGEIRGGVNFSSGDGWGGAAKKVGRRKVRCVVMSVVAEAPETLKVLVVGGGGREHAICWALKRSPR
jgi:hypothetical protein